jgi:hypothetical protein
MILHDLSQSPRYPLVIANMIVILYECILG